MNGAYEATEEDRKPMILCPICLRKLQLVLKFDIVDRYSRMKEYLDNHENQYTSETSIWLGNRLENIGRSLKEKKSIYKS
jgi:predicted Zn-dependent protease